MDCPACGCGSTSIYHLQYCKSPACGTPRTQKGKGLMLLPAILSGGYLMALPVHRIVQTPEQIPANGYPFFARPAPSQPRHGYIDSREVKNGEELKALLEEVLADDPEGEVLLCQFVASEYSGILTPNSITLGGGHDGATAGKNTAFIPLVEKQYVPAAITKKAAIKTDDWPYIEFVASPNEDITLTQLRGGPQMPSFTGDYIPKQTKIKTILKADASQYKDLGWEKEIEAHKGQAGVVVWHPKGSPTDHFSIHAFSAGMPILFSEEEPQIGVTLEPTCEEAVYDPMALLKGFAAGETLKIKDPQADGDKLVSAMLLALHNAMAMTGEASKWIGMSAAIMLRLGSIALRGEARHLPMTDEGAKQDRLTVYKKYIGRGATFHRSSLNRLINVFRYGAWPSSGFGGVKWACCGVALSELANSIGQLAKEPTAENAGTVVAKLNLAVNQAHNGGWWMNKFCSPELFNSIPKGVLHQVLRATNVMYKVHKVYTDMSPAVWEKKLGLYKKWPMVTLAPPRAMSANLAFYAETGNLEIQVSSKLLKTKFRKLMVKVPIASDTKSIESLTKHSYLVEGEEGYMLELREDGTQHVLWAEDSLREKLSDNAASKQQ